MTTDSPPLDLDLMHICGTENLCMSYSWPGMRSMMNGGDRRERKFNL